MLTDDQKSLLRDILDDAFNVAHSLNSAEYTDAIEQLRDALIANGVLNTPCHMD